MTNIKTQDSRIERLLGALRSGDAAQIEAMCHPDMVVEDPESLPYGGVYSGFAGMCEVSAKLFAAVADWKVETERIIGDAGGDDFVLVQRMTGRATSTGCPIDMSILEHYRFRERSSNQHSALLLGYKGNRRPLRRKMRQCLGDDPLPLVEPDDLRQIFKDPGVVLRITRFSRCLSICDSL